MFRSIAGAWPARIAGSCADQSGCVQLGAFEDVALRFEHAGGHGASEIFAAQNTLARRGSHFERAVEQLDQRDVERAASQVEYEQDLSSSDSWNP